MFSHEQLESMSSRAEALPAGTGDDDDLLDLGPGVVDQLPSVEDDELSDAPAQPKRQFGEDPGVVLNADENDDQPDQDMFVNANLHGEATDIEQDVQATVAIADDLPRSSEQSDLPSDQAPDAVPEYSHLPQNIEDLIVGPQQVPGQNGKAAQRGFTLQLSHYRQSKLRKGLRQVDNAMDAYKNSVDLLKTACEQGQPHENIRRQIMEQANIVMRELRQTAQASKRVGDADPLVKAVFAFMNDQHQRIKQNGGELDEERRKQLQEFVNKIQAYVRKSFDRLQQMLGKAPKLQAARPR